MSALFCNESNLISLSGLQTMSHLNAWRYSIKSDEKLNKFTFQKSTLIVL